MKSLICNVCLNSDILCAACKKRVEEGKLSGKEIKILKAINEVSKSFKPLGEVEITKIISGDRMSVIICRKGDGPRLVGKDGVMIKKLSRIVGNPLRVVEESMDEKEFIRNLISPVPLIGLNVVYEPGKEVLKVVIPRGRKIPMSRESFSKIVNQMFGKSAVVSNE
jgi:transcription antitermination factor NusA-like protein